MLMPRKQKRKNQGEKGGGIISDILLKHIQGEIPEQMNKTGRGRKHEAKSMAIRSRIRRMLRIVEGVSRPGHFACEACEDLKSGMHVMSF